MRIRKLEKATRNAAPYLILLLLFLTGCSGNDGKVSIGGTVSYDDKQLDHGLIGFHGVAQPYGSPIASDGSYATRLPPGTYRVTINAPPVPPADWKEGDTLPELTPTIPDKFALPKTSGIEVNVEQGNPQLDFELSN